MRTWAATTRPTTTWSATTRTGCSRGRPRPAGTEPPGWQWRELQADGPDQTTVTLTYDWSGVTDKALLQKVGFPLVSKDQLEDSLNKLAAAVSGS